MARTSLSDPIRIDALTPGSGLGRIGITFCPGKVDPHAAGGGWQRDLVIDLDAVRQWGACLVITLIEDHEFDRLHVTGLGEAVRRRHMDWLHLPIADVSVPDSSFEEAWDSQIEPIRSRLRAGFDVVVHCRGGLGRAGTVAARLLVEMGIEPTEAVRQVRRCRPGAIETEEQLAYALACQPSPENPVSTDEAAIRDRAVGAMLGLAVGDAIGTTLEFAARDSRPYLSEMIGGGPFGLKAGQWTDDTAMALALADSLIAQPHLDEADLMTRFDEWHRTGAYSCTGTCFDIGITTRDALLRWRRTGNPVAGSADPFSAGNGSLMRLAPVAVRHWRNRDALKDVAARQSRTTHAAEEAVDACVAWAQLLADAIEGASPSEVSATRNWALAANIASIMGGSWRGKAREDIRASGYVAHSLEASIWAVGRTADFRSAVLVAANLGEDADTTAAITGQLAGAVYGASSIPPDFLGPLAWRERIEAAANVLFDRSN